MRIISKPKRSDNGWPIICVATLLRDSTIKHPKDNFTVWDAFARVENLPKNVRDDSVVYPIKATSPLADMLMEWPAKTRLLVAGELVKDEYWSGRKGTDFYFIKAEFVHDQHNYAAASKDEDSDSADDGYVSESSYDPGF